MVLAKVFFFCARRKERLCYRCFNIFSRKRLPVVWQEKGPQGEIRKHERGLVSGGRPLVTAFHWNFSCTLMTFFILGFHLWRYKPEKEERVINRSLFCWDTLSTFLFTCLLVCFLPSFLPSFLIKSFSLIVFFFLFKAIETPSAPTKAAAPVAATRQDVYAGKEKYLARGRII